MNLLSKSTPNIAIVVLAAGASARMGEPKQLLSWKKGTLITHSVETVLQVSSKNVLVVLGAHYELISVKINDYPITILNNEAWREGLGKSIAYATDFLTKSNEDIEAVLFVLADQPFITVNYLNNMIDSFVPKKKSIVATSYDDKKIGVPVLFDKVYFKELMHLRDDNGAKHILRQNESYVKALIPPNKNVDLDTKDDYNTFLSQNFEFK